MKLSSYFYGAFVLVFLALPDSVCASPQSTSTQSNTSVQSNALSLSAINNAKYRYEGHYSIIQLKNGKAEAYFPGDSSSRWMCKIEKIALGDIDGDGAGDAVMAVGYNGGGSGYFVNLVAMLNRNGQAVQGASYDLGDRVEVKSLKINNQVVQLTMMDHALSDSMADVSVKKVISFRLIKGSWKNLSK